MTNTNEINDNAVLLGAIVDIGGLLILAMILGDSTVLERPAVFFANIIILDLIFMFWGGFVGARIAKSAEIKNSSIIGVINAVLRVVFYQPCSNYYFWYILLIGILFSVPVAILGGYVAQGRNRKRSLSTNEKSTKEAFGFYLAYFVLSIPLSNVLCVLLRMSNVLLRSVIRIAAHNSTFDTIYPIYFALFYAIGLSFLIIID